MKPTTFLPLVIAIVVTLSACSATKDNIVILESPNETGFTMELSKFNTKTKCELSLTKGDTLQVEVERESGQIALTVHGKNGSEPYTGNDLRSGMFTITVAETDEYEFRITGTKATGKVLVKNLGARQNK